MASKAHAFFCFEVLSASFGDADYPDLQTILNLYEGGEDLARDGQAEVDPDGIQDNRDPPQLPSISRLQGDRQKSQSISSTPSSVSTNSSTSQITNSTGTSITNPQSYASGFSAAEAYPLFVTWNTLSNSGHKSLRGCIGTFEALPIEKGLRQYALTSAFEDTRFSPIPAAQLPRLACSLTLLADFEECDDPFDWNLGTHGIRISFTHRYRRHGATYLPDVAIEQGWTQEETLESLMRKSGWESGAKRLGKSSSKPWEEVKDFKVVRYTGLKASAAYAEWQEWRASVKLE